ncbi:MAG: ATP-binding protein [Candidatus Marinimicrobia bacterium]|jgi:DNA replication protein DnaC|nr:ATP-binding protein [Chloroflexota bacterium]MBT4253708.1 ATP-binding protein [Candidatus Neomarinimicrobiota bacterium]MBT4533310.1 ATP-binding protein [Chloroflexota bacterium]MBT4795777.1 ATP-binding protein [Candidatus Neomarinimicrobiota bacterium]MBT6988142.1 ATP-binding protein [Chloroflexota bacterium]
MPSHQILFDQLTSLRMSAFRQALEAQLASPIYDEFSFEERLSLLVEHECVQRQNNRFRRRIRQARFQQTALVQDIDFSAKRGLHRQQVLQLAQTTWIHKSLNLIITGPTGAGKTYIACALGRAACDLDLSVRYFRLPHFFQEIKKAQLEGGYPRLVRSFKKTDLLILDDWLRDSPSLSEAQSLLDILDDRYSRFSTMLATQFPIDIWHSRIPDPTLADAILDRLVHNAHRINLQGDSQRKIRSESALSDS